MSRLRPPVVSTANAIARAWLVLLLLTLGWDAAGMDLPVMSQIGTPTGFPWRHHPLLETDRVDGVGPYGEAKVKAEQIGQEKLPDQPLTDRSVRSVFDAGAGLPRDEQNCPPTPLSSRPIICP